MNATIIEIKTGAPAKWHLWQLAAYVLLVEECVASGNWQDDVEINLDEKHEWYSVPGFSTKKDYIPVSRVISLVKNFEIRDIEASEFGTFIHACTAIQDRWALGNSEALDWEQITEKEAGYVTQWETFRCNQDFIKPPAEYIEKRLISSRRFAGTLDRLFLGTPKSEAYLVYLEADRFRFQKYTFDGLDMAQVKNEFLSFLVTAREKLGV